MEIGFLFGTSKNKKLSHLGFLVRSISDIHVVTDFINGKGFIGVSSPCILRFHP